MTLGILLCANRLAPVRWTGFDIPVLPIVTSQQSLKRKILVQLGPMNAIRGNLNPAQLLRGSMCQPRIFGHRKTHLAPALHGNNDVAVPKDG